MKAWIVRIAALVVFGVSFALPAIRMGANASQQNQMAGWMCAVVASITGPRDLARSLGQGVRLEDVQIVLGGLVNYFFLAVFVLSFWRRLVRTRLAIGALTLPCFIATWMFFASSKITPLVGHYVWIAGVVLIVAPDVVSLFSSRGAETASAAGLDAGR